MAIKKLLPDDTISICCGLNVYGGTYNELNAYRISGGKVKFGGKMYHDEYISYRDLAKAFSEQELRLILKIKQGGRLIKCLMEIRHGQLFYWSVHCSISSMHYTQNMIRF